MVLDKQALLTVRGARKDVSLVPRLQQRAQVDLADRDILAILIATVLSTQVTGKSCSHYKGSQDCVCHAQQGQIAISACSIRAFVLAAEKISYSNPTPALVQ